jgi:streptomycin 6-kinase
LHGDLHHYNILASERAPWLAIDPQGVIGEPAYETGALLRNPLPQVYEWPDFAERTARRVDVMAERLGVDRQRISGWGLAQAVLSAWWTMEDQGTLDEPVLRLARVLAPMT